METKYHMSKEDNIFFAKRKLVDNIYKSANLEGIAVTFADTYAFLNNVNNGRISINDMLKLVGLKDGWEYVLNHIDDDLTLDYIKRIHFEVCKGQNIHPLGEFRDKGVGITGTNWRPRLPQEVDYEAELQDIKNIPNAEERCLTLFGWIQRSQMFIDGNKRVANLVANKEFIKNGLGIIAIPVELIWEYFPRLINYYETNDFTELKNWLYEHALDGVETYERRTEIDQGYTPKL